MPALSPAHVKEHTSFLSRHGVKADPLPKQPCAEEFYQRVRHLSGGELHACACVLRELIEARDARS